MEKGAETMILEFGKTQLPAQENWKPEKFSLDKTSDELYFEVE